MKLFKGLAVAALLCLTLAACATNPLSTAIHDIGTVAQAKVLNPLNDRTVVALGATLGAANGVVITYGALQVCPKGQPLALGELGADGNFCHDAKLLKTLLATMITAEAAWEDLVAVQKTHPSGSVLIGGTLHDKFAAAQTAIGAVTSLTNLYVASSK